MKDVLGSLGKGRGRGGVECFWEVGRWRCRGGMWKLTGEREEAGKRRRRGDWGEELLGARWWLWWVSWALSLTRW